MKHRFACKYFCTFSTYTSINNARLLTQSLEDAEIAQKSWVAMSYKGESLWFQQTNKTTEYTDWILRSVDRAYPCTISQVSPTGCTILLTIFISLLYMFRASICPSSGGDNCICATLVFVTTSRPDATQSEKHHCRIDTVIFSWWWAHGCSKHVEKGSKYINQNCAPSWTYLRD